VIHTTSGLSLGVTRYFGPEMPQIQDILAQ